MQNKDYFPDSKETSDVSDGFASFLLAEGGGELAPLSWTTAAVVMGVLVLFSLFTVGIMRTGGIILRFALWAFLLVVMSVAFSMLWSAAGAKFMSSDGGNVAALAMTVAWLYGAVKLFRLVF